MRSAERDAEHARFIVVVKEELKESVSRLEMQILWRNNSEK